MRKNNVLIGAFVGVGVGLFATAFLDIIWFFVKKTGSYFPVLNDGISGLLLDHGGVGLKLSPEHLQFALTHYITGIFLACIYLAGARLLLGKLILGVWPILFGAFSGILFIKTNSPLLPTDILMSNPSQLSVYVAFTVHAIFGLTLWVGVWLAMRMLKFSESSGFKTSNNSAEVPGIIYVSLSSFQAIASAGTGVVIMMGAIVLIHLSNGNQAWAGVPIFLVLGVSAVLAYPLAVWKDRGGYRDILLFASIIGVIGALLAIAAVLTATRELILVGFLCIGASTCSIFLSRFAAVEITAPQQRGKALSIVMTGATIGAIGAPLIASAASSIGSSIEIKYSAPFFVILLCYCFGFFLLKFSLPLAQPEKKVIDASHNAALQKNISTQKAEDAGIFNVNIFAAMLSSIGAQAARVFLMAATPVYMHSQHYSVETISTVLSTLFVGMYGTSYVSGWLTDRIGRISVIIAGALLLIFSYAGILASTELFSIYLSLFLIGVGWNFCFISSSVILMDFAKGLKSGKIQGMNDVFVNISAGAASLVSGFILTYGGISGIGLVGLLFAVSPILAIILLKMYNSKRADVALETLGMEKN